MGATIRERKNRDGASSSWLVTVQKNKKREYMTFHTEQEAKDTLSKIAVAKVDGVDSMVRLRLARAASHGFPTVREALPKWIDDCVKQRKIRASTAQGYRVHCASRLYEHVLEDGRILGDVAVNEVTRAMLGQAIEAIRAAAPAIAKLVRSPLRTFFRDQIQKEKLGGVNPAGDLGYFVGGQSKHGEVVYFDQAEGPVLMAAAKAVYPQWHAFILTGILSGLRWGESMALKRTGDLDLTPGRERIHVQRTWADRVKRIEDYPKDGERRWVDISHEPALIAALQERLEQAKLEAMAHPEWTPEQRSWLFANSKGTLTYHSQFFSHVWKPLLRTAGLEHRKYHSTRHTYAVWHLTEGDDIRWVSKQLGHADPTITYRHYAHFQPDRYTPKSVGQHVGITGAGG